MPHTPMYLLSGLASGADQLAATWALEWASERPMISDGSPRLQLVAVLPFEISSYLEDFASDAEGRDRLLELLDRAAFRITLPGIRGSDEERESAYSQLGSFLVEQSELLVAFWDNHRLLRRGGTYHVIQKCLRSDAEASALDVQFHRRRHLLVAPTEVDLRIAPVRRRVGDNHGEPVVDLSKDVAALVERGRHDEYRARIDALNRRTGSFRTPGVTDALRQGVEERFAAIDSLASRVKRVFLGNVTALSILSVVAILCFQLFSFSSREAWAAISYVVLTLSAMVWFLVLRYYSSVEWLFVYSRAVAEAMRVQLAWFDNGLRIRVTEHYMSRRSLDVDMLRRLVSASTIETLADSAGAPGGFQEPAALAWIDDQRQYMRSRIDRESRPISLGARLCSAGSGTLRLLVRVHWIIVPLTVAVLAWVAIRAEGGEAGSVPSAPWLPLGALLIGMVLFLKSGVEYHDNAVLSREDVERFRRMLPLYDKAADLLGHAKDEPERRRILSALGKEAIDENAEWFVKHTEALKLPAVG